MEHFAGYGFNKSHSTAYALLAYQTAYLKANYPWHFAAALLTIEAQNTDKLALYLGECRERGIPVLPPDINESQLRVHRRARTGVRFGLAAIKNVGEGAIESLLEVRDRSRAASRRCTRSARTWTCGWSTSACSRAWSRRARSIRSRRPTGRSPRSPSAAFRPRLLAADRRRMRARRAASARPRRRTGAAVRRCGDEPMDAGDERGARCRCPRRRPGRRPSSWRFEKETLGLYWSGHPVDRYAGELKEFGARSTGELARAAGHRLARRRVGARRAQADRARHERRRHRRARAGSSRRARATGWRSSRSKTRRAASR